MNSSKDKENTAVEPFAIVPQRLSASQHFNPSEKLILTVCIGVDSIKLDNGKPFTHSIPSLMKMTCLSHSTTSRCLKRLLKQKIFSVYGYLISYKTKYPVYTFNYDVLKDMILTNVKMTIVGTNESTASNDVDVPANVISNVKMTFNNVRTSNIVEETLVAVQSDDRTITTESSESEGGSINTPAISGHSVSVATKTATATATKEADTITGHLVFQPGKAKQLKLPASIGPAVCAKRQSGVVREINRRYGMRFIKEGPMGTELEGFSVCAYDTNAQLILLTCDELNYLAKPHIQDMCNHFYNKQWAVIAWVGEHEVIVPMKPLKEAV